MEHYIGGLLIIDGTADGHRLTVYGALMHANSWVRVLTPQALSIVIGPLYKVVHLILSWLLSVSSPADHVTNSWCAKRLYNFQRIISNFAQGRLVFIAPANSALFRKQGCISHSLWTDKSLLASQYMFSDCSEEKGVSKSKVFFILCCLVASLFLPHISYRVVWGTLRASIRALLYLTHAWLRWRCNIG